MNHGLFRSAASPNPARASSRAASSPNMRRGSGSAPATATCRSSGPEIRSNSAGASRKIAAIAGSSARPDHRATVSAAATPPATASNITTAYPTAANRAASATSSPANRPAPAAIEALEGVQNGAARRLRQQQAPRQGRAHLAVRACSLSLQPCHTLSAAQDPQAFSIHAKARKELHRLCGTVGRSGRRGPGRRCHHRRMPRRSHATSPRTRRTATVSRNRPRPGGPDPALPAGQVRSRAGRAHRLTRRMPASQIARHRQRRDHAADPHQLTHRRKSKETAPQTSGQASRDQPQPVPERPVTRTYAAQCGVTRDTGGSRAFGLQAAIAE